MTVPATANKRGPFRVLALVGPRAAGKSTLGRALAERLALPFVDTDEALAGQTGMPAGELLARLGEAAFRAAELPVVLAALAPPRRAVVALGGGAILAQQARQRLSEPDVLTVFVTAAVPTLQARLRTDPASRPALLGEDPVAEVAAVLAARLPLYRSVADTEVDSTTATLDELVAALRMLFDASADLRRE